MSEEAIPEEVPEVPEQVEDTDVILPCSDEEVATVPAHVKPILDFLAGSYKTFATEANKYEEAQSAKQSLTDWKASQTITDAASKLATVKVNGTNVEKAIANIAAGKDGPALLVKLAEQLQAILTTVQTELAVIHSNAFALPEGVKSRVELAELYKAFAADFLGTKKYLTSMSVMPITWSQFVKVTGIPMAMKGVRGTKKAEQYNGLKYNDMSETAASLALKQTSTKVAMIVNGERITGMTFGDALRKYLDTTVANVNKWCQAQGIGDYSQLWSKLGSTIWTTPTGRRVVVSFIDAKSPANYVPGDHALLRATLKQEEEEAAARLIVSAGKDDHDQQASEEEAAEAAEQPTEEVNEEEGEAE